jgi:hypothetical protein
VTENERRRSRARSSRSRIRRSRAALALDHAACPLGLDDAVGETSAWPRIAVGASSVVLTESRNALGVLREAALEAR